MSQAGYRAGQNRLMDWLFWRIMVMWQMIMRWLSTSRLKRNADWILSFDCAPSILWFCSYESAYIHLVDFDLSNRHNQWYYRGQLYTALRFPLLLIFTENWFVNNCLISLQKQTFSCLCENLSMPTGKIYLTSYPLVIDQKLSCNIKMIFVQNS